MKGVKWGLDVNPRAIPDDLKAIPRWLCWKAEKRGNKITKVPYAAGDLSNSIDPQSPGAWTDFDSAFQAYQKSSKVTGVGFVLNGQDDIVGIDLDHCIVDGELTDTAKAIIKDADSYTEVSPSGEGIRIFGYGALPGRGFINMTEGVEAYTEKRYLTVTGGKFNGSPTDLAAFDPFWLDDFYEDFASTSTTGKSAPMPELLDEFIDLSEWDLDERAIAYLNDGDAGDLPSGSEAIMRAAGALYRAGMNDAQALTVLAGNPTAIALAEKHWKRTPLKYLWSTCEKVRDSRVAVDPDEFDEFDDEHYEPESTDVSVEDLRGIKFPTALFESAPGLVKDIYTYMEATAKRSQPRLSLAAAIAAVAGFSRNMYEIDGSRLNLYVVGIAPTGGGKENARSAIKRCAEAVEQGEVVVEDVASGPALIHGLETNPDASLFWLQDELAHVLQAAKSEGSATREVPRLMLQLFQSSASLYYGKVYAAGAGGKARERVRIQNPFLNVYAVTTPGLFNQIISGEDATSGLMNRLLVVESREMNRLTLQRPHVPVPESVYKWGINVNSLDFDFDFNSRNQVDQTSPLAIEQDKNARAAQGAFAAECDDIVRDQERSPHHRELWNRAAEQAGKVAGVLAVGVDPLKPRITLAMVEWAIAFVKWTTESMCYRFQYDVASGSDREEQTIERVLKIIRSVGEYKPRSPADARAMAANWMPHALAMKLSKMPARRFREAVATLREREDIAVRQEKSSDGDRKRTYAKLMYRAK